MFPKCFPYWVIEDKQVQNKKIKEITYSSRGFLLPCCWCDKTNEKDNLTNFGLFDNTLKLSNVASVNDVLNSPIWRGFFNHLEAADISKLPNICKQKCAALPTWGKDELQRLSE